MAENLNVAKFRNGELIPQIKTLGEWEKASNTNSPGWCYYDFKPANGEKYGKIFNWHAVNDARGLAPLGWHVPTADEFRKLINNFDDNNGAALKSKTGWVDLFFVGTNTTGFNGSPVGGVSFSNVSGHHRFDEIGTSCHWWSSTCCVYYNSSASALQLDIFSCDVSDTQQKADGYYVRLVKD